MTHYMNGALRVLIVEDDLPTLELIAEVLRGLDVYVIPIADSAEALQFAQCTEFDGIFLDLQMPNIDGLEFLRALRKIPSHRKTPVVIVTASDDNTARKSLFNAGAHFFLQKPIDRQRIRRLLNAARGAMLQNLESKRRAPLHVDVKCEARGRTTILVGDELGETTLSAIGVITHSVNTPVVLTFTLPNRSVAITTPAVFLGSGSDRHVEFELRGCLSETGPKFETLCVLWREQPVKFDFGDGKLLACNRHESAESRSVSDWPY
jgi:CheY-like chemotaxis protein